LPDYLPYSRQFITDEDVEAVVDALRSPIISQGKRLGDFEAAFAARSGTAHAVAFSSGTAALHGMCAAAEVQEADEVIVPALTFAATANAVVHMGARPVFVDIDAATLCLDPDAVASAITDRTRAILTVDFAGHPSPYDHLSDIASSRDLMVLSDAAHAPGGSFRSKPVGGLAAMTAFSFNPIKNITAAEGGMVTTDDEAFQKKLVSFLNHGMTRDPDALTRESPGAWYYEQHTLGTNYKLSELHAALGLSQLRRLDRHNARRAELAAIYGRLLQNYPLTLPVPPSDGTHCWHLYVVRTKSETPDERNRLFDHLRSREIGVQVHYIPLPEHPFYSRLGYSLDACPNTARYYKQALSLPLHPAMQDSDVSRVVDAIDEFYT
jgi:dTDP-4-amino-4,6-dideoxygalactose transaminase